MSAGTPDPPPPPNAIRVDLSGFPELLRKMSAASKKVQADTLNELLARTEAVTLDGMRANLDRPLPFTVNRPFFTAKAKKDVLQGRLALKDVQAQYLAWVFGEKENRTPGDYATTRIGALIPIRAKLNASGNFPGGPNRWLGKQIATGKTFLITSSVKQVPILMKRTSKKKVEALAWFSDDVPYQEVVDIGAIAQGVIAREGLAIFERLFAAAAPR